MTENDKLNKTVLHVFKILNVIANSNESIGISDLAHSTNLPKTTVFRLLNTLEYVGAVDKDTHQQYAIGPQIIAFSKNVEKQNSLIQIATPYMEKFAKETKENINLSILYNNQVLYLHAEQGEKFSLQVNLLPVAPLYCSSSGKIFLSDFSNEQLTVYFEKTQLQKRTVNTIVDIKELKQEIREIGIKHIAYDNEEYEYGLSCIAVPIYQNNKLIASASVSGPTSRLKVRGLEKIRSSIIDFGQLLTSLL